MTPLQKILTVYRSVSPTERDSITLCSVDDEALLGKQLQVDVVQSVDSVMRNAQGEKIAKNMMANPTCYSCVNRLSSRTDLSRYA